MHTQLRKLLSVMAVGALALSVAGTSAQAGTFDPGISTLATALGGLPQLTLTGDIGGTATLATDMSVSLASASTYRGP